MNEIAIQVNYWSLGFDDAKAGRMINKNIIKTAYRSRYLRGYFSIICSN